MFISPNKKPSSKSKEQSDLSEKITECWLRQNNSNYQELLIKEKQIQLEILEEQRINKNILKEHQKKKKETNEVENELRKTEGKCLEKKRYLQNYYHFLDSKFKSGSLPNNLFSNLQILENTLENKFQDEKEKLQNGISELRISAIHLNQECFRLKNRKQALKEELENLKKQFNQKRSEEEKIKERKNEEKKKKYHEYQSYLRWRNQLLREKISLEKLESELKKVLNIEEVHIKHWLTIQSSIKKQFITRVKDNNFKEALGMEYNLKLPELEREIKQQMDQYEYLESELKERENKLQQFQKQINNNVERYSNLEGEMMAMSNRKTTG